MLSGTGAGAPLPTDGGAEVASVFLSESADQTTAGAPVTFVAHVVASQNVEGCVVDFVDGVTGSVIGSQGVSNGAATFTWSTGATGNHEIFAQLEAGQVVSGMPSAAQLLTIGKGETVTTLSQAGAGVVATISAGGAVVRGGSVSFFEGTTLVGTVGVRGDGTAVLPVSMLKGGSHSIVAAYNGTSQWLPSTSGEEVVVLGGSSRGGSRGGLKRGRGVWALSMVVEIPAVRRNVKPPVVKHHK